MDSVYHQRVKTMLQKLARERDMGVGAGVNMGGVNMGGVLMGAGPKGTKKVGPQEWVFSKEGEFRSWNPELDMYETKLRKIGEQYIAMPKALRASKRALASKKYRESIKLGERTIKPRKIKQVKPKRKLNEWQQYVKDNKTSGVSFRELSDRYKAEKGEISQMVSSALANVEAANPAEIMASGLYGMRKRRYF